MELTSASLIYRQLSEQDYPLYRLVFSDENVMRYAYHDKTDDEEQLRNQFDELVAQGKLPTESRPTYMYSVYEKQSGAFVGFADIVMEFWHTKLCGEIGYFLVMQARWRVLWLMAVSAQWDCTVSAPHATPGTRRPNTSCKRPA